MTGFFRILKYSFEDLVEKHEEQVIEIIRWRLSTFFWGQSYNMVLCKYIFRNLNWPFISGGCNVQRNVKILMYPFVKLSLILKCIQINKLRQNVKFLRGFLFNLNHVFFCKTVIGIKMHPNKQIVSKCKIFAGISLQLEKVNAIYFNIVLVL